MKKVLLWISVLGFFFASTVTAGNTPGSIIIEDNLNFTVSRAGLLEEFQIDFILKPYFNPQDPENLYWKMDLDTLKFSDPVATFAGSGIRNTRPFTVSGPWEAQWDAKGSSFSIYLYTATGSLDGVIASQQGPGQGYSYQPNPGQYFLKVNAIGDWDISIVHVGDN